jgi:lysophospholipase L1-like esterase
MKTILCYGDSNTWGSDPATHTRFDREVRWPGVLRRALGDGVEIIEEGMNGRTTVLDDPFEPFRNGLAYLYPCLVSHLPLDLVILMLGTNDLKKRFNVPASDIAEGVRRLVLCVRQAAVERGAGALPILLICPPPLGMLSEFDEMFAGGKPKSRRLSTHYEAVAQEMGCHFLDAGRHIVSSDIDGIHLEASEHRKLGLAIAEKVAAILKT